jgi:sugar phosphate isomerase/epimerase
MNNKMFSKYTPCELINTITKMDKTNSIDGAEIYINITSNIEKEYCLELVKLMKDRNWIVQIHSMNLSKLEYNTLKEYLDYYNKLSTVYLDKLKLTIHPSDEKDIKEATVNSINLFNAVNEYITKNNYNIEILVENLNKLNGKIRCNVNEVIHILDNVDIDGITLDLGHYVYDYSNDYSNICNIDKIKNIHLHDINNNVDHYPFYYNNVKLDKIAKYLKEIKYNANIVLEYGLEYLKGTTFEEKINEYINQIEYVKNSINN